MKFNFKNLGPINEANIELKKLTIITGDNNTGKTYLAYSIYFFLKYLRSYSNFYFVSDNTLKDFIKKCANKLKNEENFELDLIKYKSIIRKYINNVSKRLKKDMSDLFKVEEDYFKTFSANLFIDDKIKNQKIYLKDNPYVNIITEIKNNKFIFKCDNPETSIEQIKGGLIHIVNKTIEKNIANIFVVTAERLGIVLFKNELNARRSLVIEQLQKSSMQQKGLHKEILFDLVKQFTSRYSSSIHDNIDYVNDKFPENKKIGKLEKQNKLAKKIEKIMGGRLAYNSTGHEMRFVSNKRNNKINIPMHFTSTSIRSLSLLFHYLKYNAIENDLIIIDEPESHLSLKNQIKLSHIISACINSGLKIMITTHSDFILKEINNLIMLHNVKKKINNLKEVDLKDYNKSDAIDPNDVSAYFILNNHVKKSKIDKFGIDNELVEKSIKQINLNSYNLENIIIEEE